MDINPICLFQFLKVEMKMRGIVIRDITVRSSQQAYTENMDHESQKEVGQSYTVNPPMQVFYTFLRSNIDSG